MVPDSDGKLYYNLFKKDSEGIYHYFIFVYGQMTMIHTKLALEQLRVMNVFDAIQNNGWSPDIPIGKSEVQQYQRDDQSTFMIVKSKDLDAVASEYYYFDIKLNKDGTPIIRRATILSEMKLDADWSSEMRSIIANNLLSQIRLKRKLEHARGYVGYVGSNHGIFYDRDFEEDKLHLIEHAL